MAIELFHWEYRPPVLDLPYIRRFKRAVVPNFGDEIGPMVVRAVAASRGLRIDEAEGSGPRLFSVGSVLHFAQPGDHVWGTGINAKRPLDLIDGDGLTVHAVRGPRTADALERKGVDVPRVFGDPGLLIRMIPEIEAVASSEKKRKLAVIPNFNDLSVFRRHPDLVSPLQPPVEVARAIAESEFVVGSSLHAMVFADALGVPSRLITSQNEHPFKYEDYYLGTGRPVQAAAHDLEHALRMGPAETSSFDDAPLLAAFPEGLMVSDRG